jgi:hypothetical protein
LGGEQGELSKSTVAPTGPYSATVTRRDHVWLGSFIVERLKRFQSKIQAEKYLFYFLLLFFIYFYYYYYFFFSPKSNEMPAAEEPIEYLGLSNSHQEIYGQTIRRTKFEHNFIKIFVEIFVEIPTNSRQPDAD